MNEKRARAIKEFEHLLDVMDELREKCPWDKKQTWQTLRTLTIEETYELADAILEDDSDGIREELGDLMLHLVFYAKIGDEKGDWDIADVLNQITKKLIFRHPHIFGDVKVSSAREVLDNWESIKLAEGEQKTVLGGIPKSLPTLIKAHRIQDKARGVGFDWTERNQVWDKVAEEIEELKVELSKEDNAQKREAEFGDLFFSLVNAARLWDINPENALEKTNLKFIQRFNYLEQETLKKGKDLREMSLEEMDKYWNAAKDLDQSVDS